MFSTSTCAMSASFMVVVVGASVPLCLDLLGVVLGVAMLAGRSLVPFHRPVYYLPLRDPCRIASLTAPAAWGLSAAWTCRVLRLCRSLDGPMVRWTLAYCAPFGLQLARWLLPDRLQTGEHLKCLRHGTLLAFSFPFASSTRAITSLKHLWILPQRLWGF